MNQPSLSAFSSGALRVSDSTRPDLTILPWTELERLSFHYMRGATLHGRDNWQKGIPSSRYLRGLARHLADFQLGRKPEEDHLSAILFNALGIMYNQRHHADSPEINDLPGPTGLFSLESP